VCCHVLQVRIVRIFNTYGPRMALDDGRVVSNFVSQALTNQPITIYGDGQQVGGIRAAVGCGMECGLLVTAGG
jgi:nucleoside-diphosphate-sugar epimerase